MREGLRATGPADRAGTVPARRYDFLVAAALVLLAPGYLLLPAGRPESLAYTALVVACALVLLAVVAASPARRPWRLLVLTQLLFTTAEVVTAHLDLVGASPSPSPADVFFLAGQVAQFLAVLRLLPAPRGGLRRGSMLDVVVVTGSVGMLFVVYTVLPALDGSREELLARLVAAAYPVADIAVVFLLVRTTGWRSGRPGAFWWLTAGLLASVVADVTVAVLVAAGQAEQPRWARLLWLVFYACVTAAACSPSAPRLGRPPVADRPGAPLVRLPLLGTAALLPPLAGVLEHLVPGAGDHGVALGIVTVVVVALVLVRLWDLLRVTRSQAALVERLAETDPLTGLPNRRAWDAEVARVFASARAGGPVSVAIVDLDHFKAYNDTRGHDGGDDLLVRAARAWTHALPGVFLARWGGEEFTVLLPGVAAHTALGVLRAVHDSVPDGQTCSIGVATWDGAEVPPAVLARADAALYRAKRTGRDRTVVDGGHPLERAG
ncbi:GGDEF domain-containing protein [Kineococcus rhizosphaerae]|uniref:Diguanylate cyclase (GGDEF)-like protein n=1 Tax=Kineococcus rhizosphaerae TaxID=559628 RepID=A0A2T0R2M4_9ACTN|nr:GGDEF domain-containing protein [Kineococcus rhizosphaerae]PRY14067.1 diguanylate cyclase (GGDEF)-like protein [Kineococcus rhizosphaerae]